MKHCICLAADENYFPLACILAKSILDAAETSYPVAIVHDGVTDASLAKGKSYLGEKVLMIDASPRLATLRLRTTPLVSRASYLRLFIEDLPELRPFAKALYLDCDVQVKADLAQLLAIPHRSAPLIAAYDFRLLVSSDHRRYLPMTADSAYFNAGVLSLDLEWIRKEGQFERARRFAVEHQDLCRHYDQDPLNVAFCNNWQTLDWRWNVQTIMLRNLPPVPYFLRHFEARKPWAERRRGVEPEAVLAFAAMIRRSPWPEHFYRQNTLERTRDGIQSLLVETENTVKELVAAYWFTGNVRRRFRARLSANFEETLQRIASDAAEALPARRLPEKNLIP